VQHLGNLLAESGVRTLLVEADLRKPDLAGRLGLSDEGGLSLYLSGHQGPLPVIHETDNPNMFVVSAGPAPPNPFALFNSERLKQFLQDMSASFRFILLDAPPVLGLADARVLGSRSDGVLIVTRAHRTGVNLVRRAAALLSSSGANILGIVVNGVNVRESDGLYYRYYYRD
jgi:capsular exopolysaccharide synthesis family protein